MADAIIIAVVVTLAILAIRHCRKHGAPCECGCNHKCGCSCCKNEEKEAT